MSEQELLQARPTAAYANAFLNASAWMRTYRDAPLRLRAVPQIQDRPLRSYLLSIKPPFSGLLKN
jgi:hypothetical protein